MQKRPTEPVATTNFDRGSPESCFPGPLPRDLSLQKTPLSPVKYSSADFYPLVLAPLGIEEPRLWSMKYPSIVKVLVQTAAQANVQALSTLILALKPSDKASDAPMDLSIDQSSSSDVKDDDSKGSPKVPVLSTELALQIDPTFAEIFGRVSVANREELSPHTNDLLALVLKSTQGRLDKAPCTDAVLGFSYQELGLSPRQLPHVSSHFLVNNPLTILGLFALEAKNDKSMLEGLNQLLYSFWWLLSLLSKAGTVDMPVIGCCCFGTIIRWYAAYFRQGSDGLNMVTDLITTTDVCLPDQVQVAKALFGQVKKYREQMMPVLKDKIKQFLLKPAPAEIKSKTGSGTSMTGCILGAGRDSTVVLGIGTAGLNAIKLMNDDKALQREIRVLKIIEGHNIGPTLQSFNEHSLTMTFQGFPLPIAQRLWSSDTIQKALEQLPSKLRRLHDLGVLHADLHAGNILLDNNGEELYLCDFANSSLSFSEEDQVKEMALAQQIMRMYGQAT